MSAAGACHTSRGGRPTRPAIKTSGLDCRGIATYLVEGVTWARLKLIATRETRLGASLFFKEGSHQYRQVFGTAPAAMMSRRPHTDAALLQLLCGREHILHRLAVTDLRQRRLGQEATQAIASLGDITLRIRRGTLFEVLQRAMFLYNWSCAHPHVASVTSWDDGSSAYAPSVARVTVMPFAVLA